MDIIYTGKATTSGGGREGITQTSDGKVKLQLAYPKEIGGSGEGTNPEQLVAMGYSACFGSALTLVARRFHVDPTTASTTCSAHLHKEGDGYSLTFEIEVELPGVEADVAARIVEAAHKTCPYSRAFGHGTSVTARAKLPVPDAAIGR